MRAADRTGLAVILSVFLATLTVTPLTEDQSFLGLSWLLIAILGVVTIGLRRARFGSGAVIGVQALIFLGFAVALAASMPGAGEPWYQHFTSLWASGIEHMRTQASPMEPNDGVKLIFVLVIGVIMIMTDLLVSGINRPVWAIAPPTTLFLVPAIGLGTDTGLFAFACIAVGYLAILVAEGLNSTTRWTHGLSRDSAEGFGTATPVVWRAAGYIGLPAVVLTCVLGLIMPTLSLPGFGFGSGSGGNGPLQLSDPTLDLRRNLRQAADVPVITYQSDAAGGVYLRMASLPQFSSAGWTNVPMRLGAGTTLPDVPGLSTVPSKRRTTTINVLNFGSEYLPTPYAPRSFSAPGDWVFDPNSLIVLSRNDGTSAIRNISYTVESVDIAPNPRSLAGALAGTPQDSATTLKVPADLPPSFNEVARSVTAGADTQPAQAAAIQQYLRGGRFTYSTDPQPGSSYAALENFLIRDRKGYCEQFAASMALLARLVGIPSRVAVGFLPGERKGDSYEVTIRDMHAWPELYFSGFGWVRYEPTPAIVTGGAPAWTLDNQTNPGDDPSAAPSNQSSSAVPSTSLAPSSAPTQGPTDPGAASGFPWERTIIGSGIGLVLLLILAAPATLRIRRRTARLTGVGLAEEQVESAWAEIRDTVVDHGGRWPDGSPRSIGSQIGDRLSGEESTQMGQVATLVERSRYARAFVDDDIARQLPELTQDIRRGIAAPRSRWRRVRAFVMPTSLFRRPRP